MNIAAIPMKSIGPIKITGPVLNDEFSVPLATFESPLWPSTQRGAKVSMLCDGISVVIVDERMARSVVFDAPSAEVAVQVIDSLKTRFVDLKQQTSETSRFAELIDWHYQLVGSTLYIRFEFLTGDASGHNMVTKASDHLMQWILHEYPALHYVSISGNYCTDKKVSAVNGILGRGKSVVAEMMIPRAICQKSLRTTPEKMIELNLKKNWIGTSLAGGLRSANAHFANILLALYLATGQDAANIIEGSQGFVHTEIRDDALYFSATLPNVIVGTVGNGKDLEFVQENLKALGCLEKRSPGENARRLAAIVGATVLCGELSLLAAQTNPGELMRSHLVLER